MSMALSLPLARASMPEVELRVYQRRAVERVHALIRDGVRRILVVAPTGAGKTVIASRLMGDAVAANESTLMLAHRRELIDQAYAKTLDGGIPPELVGVVMASDRRRNPGASIQIASVDTLRAWVGKRALPRAHIIIVDEAHRSVSASYRSIIDAYVAMYPDVVVIGLTATPWRLDNKGLGDLFDEPVIVATIPELIDQGFLVSMRCFSHPSRPNLSDVRVRAGEFVEEDVKRAMGGSLLLGSVTEHYKARADGRAAFGFAVDVEEAHRLADACNAAGIPSVAVSGETSADARATALEDLRRGRVRIVWNCQLFTEGTDVPEVKAIILARPTLSRALAFQMIGRGMRPCTSTGFADCIVLDHAGVLQIHGHPLEPQDYSLSPTKPKRNLGCAMTKTCPACSEEVALGALRCACGHEWDPPERSASQVTGQLVEYMPRPAVILSPNAEEQMCRAALKKAIDQGAKNPIPYARTILERQLRRDPDKAIFERVALAMLAKPKTPAPSAKPMPTWLASSLGVAPPAPEATREADPPPPAVPLDSSEDVVEFEF